MSKTDDLIKHLEGQGATVRRTKKGLVIHAPNGGTTAMHFTPSDHRALDNNKAALRRIGLTHPEDKKPQRKKATRNEEGYPEYIYAGEVTPATRKAVLAWLEQKDWPLELTVHELSDAKIGTQTTVTRALYVIGYRWSEERKKGKRGSIIWVAPDDIADLHLKRLQEKREWVESMTSLTVAPAVTPDPEQEPECTHTAWEEFPGGSRVCADCREPLPPLPQPEQEPVTEEPEVQVKKVGEREFIDSVDSWTVDLRKVPFERDMIPEGVRQYIEGLRAAGLEVEIRVWRKEAQ